MYALIRKVRARTWVLVLLGALVTCALACFWRFRNVRDIPLATVASTIPQRNLHEIAATFFPKPDGSRVFAEPYGPDLERIGTMFLGKDHDIFLVRGNNLVAAVKAASRRFVEKAPAEAVIDPNDGMVHGDVWLVFYLGSSSTSPPKWQVQSVQIDGNTISVRYWEPWRSQTTRDYHQYLGWAPLGRLAPGSYSLELRNASQWQTVRSRSVAAQDLPGLE